MLVVFLSLLKFVICFDVFSTFRIAPNICTQVFICNYAFFSLERAFPNYRNFEPHKTCIFPYATLLTKKNW